MTKRIFRSICFAALGVFFASVLLFTGVLYHYFSGEQRNQLRMQTQLAARAVSREGMGYLNELDADEAVRITWIGADGEVLFDSRSDSEEMENHLEREEIREALASGFGESSRYSVTLMERALYCAQRLEDGTVLRMSVSQSTPLTLIFGMAQPICIIFALAAILSFALASRLSRQIVAPLNRLNLDEPLENEGYDELSPLLRRIDLQKRQIARQSEELLQKQKEFEAVTENMAEGILLLNAKGFVLSINPAARRLLAQDGTSVGQHLLSVNRSLQLSELLEQMEKGRHGEKVLELKERWYQLDISPVFSEGEVSGAVLLVLDVTEKEKAEQMRREFTANVSHELKTPLHTISGCAELLENGMVKKEDLPRFYAQIQTEAQRMIHLVEDIIRLSHLDEGAAEMKRENVELYALAKGVVEALSAQAETAKVEVKLKGEVVVVWGVSQLLQSILYNLCENAIKYNCKGGSVTVTVGERQGQAMLCVADTGIGIPPEHQDRIFERFYRVDKSRSKKVGGTGLGLSIVKHAARLHDAKIELKSEPGKGTEITVLFPEMGR